jgi:hypothetical protein
MKVFSSDKPKDEFSHDSGNMIPLLYNFNWYNADEFFVARYELSLSTDAVLEQLSWYQRAKVVPLIF